MRFIKTLFAILVVLMAFGLFPAQNKTSGKIKGKVRAEVGNAGGVKVAVRQGEREVATTTTDKGGDFEISLPPGVYGLTFRKPGLSIGTIENIEVKAGKTRGLGDRLILTIDEGSIAFIRGSVFNAADRSLPNAKVELGRIQDDGSVKKIDSRLTTETGTFVFRLSPEPAKYRVTLKLEGADLSKDVEVDGAAVYRVALSLAPPPKPTP